MSDKGCRCRRESRYGSLKAAPPAANGAYLGQGQTGGRNRHCDWKHRHGGPGSTSLHFP